MGDAAVTFLVQKKGSKKEIPPYQQQQQAMHSGYTKPSVPGTNGSAVGSMYSSKLGSGKVNAPGFGKSSSLPTPPMPPVPPAGTGGMPSAIPQQLAGGNGGLMNVNDQHAKPTNF